jgi:hypothetical protein
MMEPTHAHRVGHVGHPFAEIDEGWQVLDGLHARTLGERGYFEQKQVAVLARRNNGKRLTERGSIAFG